MKYIIVSGNPGDGFEYWGTFNNADDAVEHAQNDSYFDGCTWWVLPLNPAKDAR